MERVAIEGDLFQLVAVAQTGRQLSQLVVPEKRITVRKGVELQGRVT